MKRRAAIRTPKPASSRRVDAELLRRVLLAAVLFAPLALGAAHPATDAVLWLVVLLAAALHLPVAWRDPQARLTPFTTIALLAVAAVALLRSTNLGAFLASAQVTEAWSLWPQLGPRGVIAPDVTPGAVLRLAAMAAAVQLGATLFGARVERQKLALAAIAGTLIAAAAGLAQHLSGATRVLFFYEPHQVGRALEALSGPFVNANQAGALAAIGAIFAAVGAWRDDDPTRRIGLAAASLALSFWCIALDAGAASVALAGGLVVLALGAATSKLGAENRAAQLATAVGLFLVIALPWLAITQQHALANTIFSPTQLAKAAFWRDGLQLITQAPLLGHGIGSWSDLAPSVLADVADTRRAYPESAFLQFALEHGLIASALLVAALVADLGPWLLLRSGIQATPWRIAAAALFTAFGLEFALGLGHQAGAIALIVAITVGMAAGTARSQRLLARRQRPTTFVPVARHLIVPIAVLLIGLVAAVQAPRSMRYLLRPPEHAAAALVGQPTSLVNVELPLLAARAPASPGIVALGASLAAARGDTELAERRMLWLKSHAPRYAGTWGAALDLATRRNDAAEICSALSQLLALGDYPAPFERVSSNAADWVPCLPQTPEAQRRVFTQLLREDRVLDVLVLAGSLLIDDPRNPAALEAAAQSSLRADLVGGARHYAEELRREHPSILAGWLIGADAAARDGDDTASFALLDDAIARLGPFAPLLLARAEGVVAAAEAGDKPEGWRDRMRADLDACAAEALGRPALQRTHALLRARAALADNDPHRAASILDTLLQRENSDAFATRLRARAAGALDDARDASLWWRRLLELLPGDSEARRALEATP